jgi:hypothetical protein
MDPAPGDGEAPAETEPGRREPAAAADGSLPEAGPDPSAEPLAVARYALPGARTVVASGFGLLLTASRDLRAAGIYVGLLTLATLGPAALALLPLLDHLGAGADLGTGPAAAGVDVATAVMVAAIVSAIGAVTVVAVAIDATIIALALLGGRAIGRPLTLREAVARARQTFWRVLLGLAAVSVVGVLASRGVGLLLGPAVDAAEADVLATVVQVAATLPLVYLPAAVVLGDVGVGVAIGRSIAMVRVRPRLAAVVAIFALGGQLLAVFGTGAAADELWRVGELLHVSAVDGDGGRLLGAGLVAVACLAFGSLQLTIEAIVMAPQVTAFLGLTHHDRGLDGARAVPGARPTRLVSRPMAAAVGVEVLGALAVLASTH